MVRLSHWPGRHDWGWNGKLEWRETNMELGFHDSKSKSAGAVPCAVRNRQQDGFCPK